MENILGLEDKVGIGRYKNRTVSEMLDMNRNEIFNLLKKGIQFDDEVLEKARVTKSIRDVQTKLIVIDHEAKDTKVYQKDTTPIKSIINGLHTIVNTACYSYDEDNEEKVTVKTNNESCEEL